MSDTESAFVEDVERSGFSVLWVFDDGGGAPDFGYTVGLTVSCGHPEFAIVGLPREVSIEILSGIAGRTVAGSVYHEGERIGNVLEGFDVLIGPVERDFISENMRQATAFAGAKSIDALQVLWPDQNGSFPTEAGFDSRLVGRQALR